MSVRIIHPESRTVSEDTIVTWAQDYYTNEAPLRACNCGLTADDCQCPDALRWLPVYADGRQPPTTFEEARALLSDAGEVTFAADARQPPKGRVIEFSLWSEEHGDEVVHQLPACWAICGGCKGDGRVLNPSIARHAYTCEDLEESFGDDVGEYMKGAHGIYGVTCDACNGSGKVLTVDEANVEPDVLVLYQASQREERRSMREWVNEIRTQDAMAFGLDD